MLAPLLLVALQSRLDAILDDPKLSGATIAVCVARADGRVLYQRDAARRLMPASNQKLFTVAYALHELGPDYAPRTRFWRLQDRVVVDAPGDPSLTYEQLREAARRLGSPIRMPVFARQAYKPRVGPTWELDDLPFRFAARITALSFDRGVVKLVASKGMPVLEPEAFGIRILHFPYGERSQELDPFGGVLVVHGELPKERAELAVFAIPEPDRAAASILGGPLLATEFVPEPSPDYEIRGKQLLEMAKECLAPSDNYVAEHLLLSASGRRGRLVSESPYPAASGRMRAFLTGVAGIESGDIRPVDGSGMSRHNQATARSYARLLTWMRSSPHFELWKSSMAAPGVGTLRTRLQNVAFVGKTGSLDMVAALSGYVTTKAGDELAVSLIVNHFSCTQAEVREILDRFVRELAEGSGIGTLFEVYGNRETTHTDKHARSADAHRVSGPGGHGMAAQSRARRRAESLDAAASGTGRVGVRAG